MSEDEKSYKTIKNDLNLTIPSSLNKDNGIIINDNNKSIEMIPMGSNVELDRALLSDEGQFEIEKVIGKKELEAKVNSKPFSRSINDEEEAAKIIFKYSEDLSVSYMPTKLGVKEEFILNKNTGQNIFSTKVKLDGYKLELLKENNSINIISVDTEEVEGIMPQPIVYDSSESRKETLNSYYRIEELGDNEYLINITVDKEFLNDAEVQYPVYIDPTYTKILPNSTHTSRYVFSAQPLIFYGPQNSMPAGWYSSSQGYSRTFVSVKTDILENDPEVIVSAKYKIYSKGGYNNIGAGDFSLYSIPVKWNEDRLCWNNQPAMGEKIDSKYLSNSSLEMIEFDITKFASLYKKGQSFGFAIKAENERWTYRNFGSEHYSGLEPYMEIVYGKFDKAPTLTATGGDYNTSQGSVKVSWEPIPGVKGYKLGIFNGRYFDYANNGDYTWIDVGNTTNYDTKGKGIWPTPQQIQHGSTQLRTDGTGGELAEDPSILYSFLGEQYAQNKNYYFKVIAYNAYGVESVPSPNSSITLPDRTKPIPVNNLTAEVIEDSSNGEVQLHWGNSGNISYKSCIDGDGWQSLRMDGQTSGTTEQAKKMEAIQISLSNSPSYMGVRYKSHIEGIGWEADWKQNNEVSGEAGAKRRIEAIKIELINNCGFNIEYRAHVQDVGWQPWVKNGEISGTTGQAKRLEAIEIRLVNDTVKYKLEKRKALIDGNNWDEYSVVSDNIQIDKKGYKVSNLDDGYKHQFRVTGYDKEGNYSDSVISSELIIKDKTPPIIGDLSYNRGYTNKDKFLISYSNLNDISGIKDIQFKVNDDEYKSYPRDSKNALVDLSGLNSGIHKISYRFIDVFDNKAEGSIDAKRDIDLPEVKLQPQNLKNGSYFNGVMAIDVSANDILSDIRIWKLEAIELDTNGNNTSNIIKITEKKGKCNETVAFDTSKLKEGTTYKLKFYAKDNAENEAIETFVFIKSEKIENVDKELDINLTSGKITSEKTSVYNSLNKSALYLYNSENKEIKMHDSGSSLVLDALKLKEGENYYAYISEVNNGQIKYSKDAYKTQIINDELQSLNNFKETENIILSDTGIKLIDNSKDGYIYLNEYEFDYFVDAINLKTVQVGSYGEFELYSKNEDTNEYIKIENEYGIYRLNNPSKKLDLMIKITGVRANSFELDCLSIYGYGAFSEKAPSGVLITPKLVQEPQLTSIIPRLDYKIKVNWRLENTKKIKSSTEDIKYNIYRGKDKDFKIGDENKIASKITGNSFSDYNLNYGETFYYKVTTVKEFNGVDRESISSQENLFAKVIDKDEIDKKVGKQDYYDFVDYSTAEGVGSINIANQNLVYQAVDISVTSPSLAMLLKRTYNSTSTTKSSFGYSFDYSFNTVLLKEFDGEKEVSLLLKDGDGTIHRFTKNQDGSYNRPKGIFLKLEHAVDERQYKITRDDAIVYIFDEQLRLTKFIDKNENFLEFVYNEFGEIDRILNNVGDAIYLFHENGLIKKAVDISGTMYFYDYDDNERLIEVKTYIDNKNDEANTRVIKYNYNKDSTETNIFGVVDYKGNTTIADLDLDKKVEKVTTANDEYFTVKRENLNVLVQDDRQKAHKYILNEDELVKSYINPLGQSYSYDYNEDYLITKSYTYKEGQPVITENIYNENGKLLKTIDPSNNWSELTYYDNGDVDTMVVPILDEENLSITKYHYDSNRNVEKVVDPLNRETKYTYNKNGQVVTTTDVYGNITTNIYDNKGRVEEVIDQLGRKEVSVRSFDRFGNPTVILDKTGNTIYKTYNSFGELIYFKDIEEHGYFEDYIWKKIESRYEEYYYDKNSNLELVVDSRGRRTSYEYDKVDRLTKITYADGTIEEYKYTYDAETGNDIDIIIDPDGVETKIYYDKLGRVNKKTVGDTLIIENEYDELGNLTKTLDGEGRVKEATYDIVGRQTALTIDPGNLNIKQDIKYDKYGKIEKVVEPSGAINEYNYDKLGRITESVNLIGVQRAITEYKYDEKEGGLIKNSVIDPLGRKKESLYDNVGRKVKERVYGDENNTKKMETKYTYNYYTDDVETIIDANSVTQVFRYNRYGDLVETKYIGSRGGVETTSEFKYDAHRRLEKTIHTSKGSTRINSYTYNNNDEVVQKIQANQTIDYKYKDSGRLESISYPDELGKDRKNKISYDYDKSGRLEFLYFNDKLVNEHIYTEGNKLDKTKYYSKFDTDGNDYLEIDYTHNSAGMPELINYKKNGQELKEKYEIKYEDKTGFVKSEIYSEYYNEGKENKLDKSYTYDLVGRLEKSTTNKGTTSYEYDILGNKKKETKEEIKDGKTDTTVLDYIYGDFNRLNAIKKNEKDHINYTYDSIGNTLSQIEATEDDNGNKKNITTNYGYNYRNELITATVMDGNSSSITNNYYDIDGKRVGKEESVVVEGNKTNYESNYVYQGDAILFTTDRSGNKATENILDPTGGIVATKRFDGNHANKFFKYTYDTRGSIVSILDPEINRVKGYGYDDFGNTTEVGDSTFNNEIKYAGMVEDEASGLHYMNARHYNPSSGRFLTEDTFDDPMSPDGYAYGGNNPINYIDPTGHFVITASIAAIAAIKACAIVAVSVAAAVAVDYALNKAGNYLWDMLWSSRPNGYNRTNPGSGPIKNNPGYDNPALPGNPTLDPFPYVEPYVEPMINGRPVSEVAAEQNATHNSAMATAEENAKKAKEKADAKAKAEAEAAEKEKKKEKVGSYTIHFASGMKYHGKGPKSRMAISAAFRAGLHRDTVTATYWTPAKNDEEAFIQEYLRLKRDGGPTSKTNYNVYESPGKKLHIRKYGYE